MEILPHWQYQRQAVCQWGPGFFLPVWQHWPMIEEARIPDQSEDDVAQTRIREWRVSKELTLEQLSAATEISVSYLSRMESGKRNVSFANLRKIAKAMDITPRELMPHLLRVPLMWRMTDDGSIILADKVFGRAIAQESSTSRTSAALIGEGLGSMFSGWVLYFDIIGSENVEYYVGTTCVVSYSTKNSKLRRTLAKVEESLGGSAAHITLVGRGPVFNAHVHRCHSVGALVPPKHAISQIDSDP